MLNYIDGIEFRYLIFLLYCQQHKQVTLKLFNFYYPRQALKLTAQILKSKIIYNIKMNRLIIFPLAIIYGIEFKDINYSPLISASQNGHTEVVRLLLSQPGIEINHKNI